MFVQVLLVGGFAASPHLQASVRHALVGGGLADQLIIPPNPHVAVLSGERVQGPPKVTTRLAVALAVQFWPGLAWLCFQRTSLTTHSCSRSSPVE